MEATVIGLGLLKVFTKLSAFQCKSTKCLIGRVALVTGGNSGIGYEIAQNLASRGCKVIILDVVNGEKTAQKIKERTGNNSIEYKHVDLGSLESVRKLSNEIRSKESRLDILVNNAATFGNNGRLTDDGILKTMQVNWIGPFLLTYLLTDLLIKSDGRIVFLTCITGFLHKLNMKAEINKPNKYKNTLLHSFCEYNNSCLATLAGSTCFADQLRTHGVTVNCVHPGFASTNFNASAYQNMNSRDILTLLSKVTIYPFVYIYGKSSLEGSQMPTQCAVSSNIFTTGRFYVDKVSIMLPRLAQISAFRWKLWEESEKLAKIKPEEKLNLI